MPVRAVKTLDVRIDERALPAYVFCTFLCPSLYNIVYLQNRLGTKLLSVDEKINRIYTAM